jgi:apolipoprotein D and lipocalin family protein
MALLLAGLIVFGMAMVSCSSASGKMDAPPTAKSLDLKRYAGRWHEIARLPMPFQKIGEAAIAEYGINADGTISVRNTAIRPDGSQRDIRGYARVLNPPTNTKLAVRFSTWFGPLIPVSEAGNYWILHIDERYQEAIVGTPDRKYLWILARTSTLPQQRYEDLAKMAGSLGFDVSLLIKSPNQP